MNHVLIQNELTKYYGPLLTGYSFSSDTPFNLSSITVMLSVGNIYTKTYSVKATDTHEILKHLPSSIEFVRDAVDHINGSLVEYDVFHSISKAGLPPAGRPLTVIRFDGKGSTIETSNVWFTSIHLSPFNLRSQPIFVFNPYGDRTEFIDVSSVQRWKLQKIKPSFIFDLLGK